MSRTQELQEAGAVRRGEPKANGEAMLEPTPFVKWPEGDEYTWVEGVVKSLWTGKYGENVTLTVFAHSPGLSGRVKDSEVAIVPEMAVNVSLNSSALKDKITSNDTGEYVHVAFEGWRDPVRADGNRYRDFTVLVDKEWRSRPKAGVPPVEDPPPAVANDELPF
jgi:hypothetical protein